MQTQILPQATETTEKSEIRKFNMADGRRVENHFFGYNSAEYCPIKIKFGVRRQKHTHTKQVRWSNA